MNSLSMNNYSDKNLERISHDNVLNTIAHIFLRVYAKINLNISNNLTTSLSFEVFNDSYKQRLMRLIVSELEKFIINLFSSNLSLQVIREKKRELSINLILNISEKLFKSSYLNPYQFGLMKNALITNNAVDDVCTSLDLLLYMIQKDVFSNIPREKLESLISESYLEDIFEALLDNTIIRLSHCICYILLDLEVLNDVSSNYSNRDINNFRNTLSREFYLERYLYKPKSRYEGKYLLWVLSPRGIFCRYLNLNSLISDSNTNNFVLLLFEFFDFVKPMVFSLFITLRKILTSFISKIFIEFLEFFQFLLKLVSNRFYY